MRILTSYFPFLSNALQRFLYWRYHFSLISIVSLLVCLFSVAVCWILYRNINFQAQNRVQKEGERIAKELNDIFQETHTLMTNIGHDVVKSHPADFLQIWQQVTESFGSDDHANKSFIWPDFGWVNAYNQKIFYTETAMTSFAEGAFQSITFDHIRQHPWKLQFVGAGPHILGKGNEEWLIPVGMGITNASGDFIGVVTAIFHVANLMKTIDEVVKDNSVKFAVIDEKGKIILQTPGKRIEDNKNAADELKNLVNRTSGSTHPNDAFIDFYFTKQINDTPYSLVTYLDHMTVTNGYYQVFIPRVIKILAGGVCYLLLAYFFLKNFIKKNRELAKTKKQLEDAMVLARASDKAKEGFLKRVRQELLSPFVNIVTYAEILSKYFKGELDLELSSEKQLQFLERIQQACLDLKTLTTNVVDLAIKDIQPILEECLKIQAKDAYLKGVELKGDIPVLPVLLIDELRFKQIIVGLLARAIRCTHKGEKVSISAKLFRENEKKLLKIEIQDTGIGLAEEEWQRMASQYQARGISRFSDGTELELSAIERLIKMLNGTYSCENIWKQGNRVTLLFPYDQEMKYQNQSAQISLDKTSVLLCDWSSQQ